MSLATSNDQTAEQKLAPSMSTSTSHKVLLMLVDISRDETRFPGDELKKEIAVRTAALVDDLRTHHADKFDIAFVLSDTFRPTLCILGQDLAKNPMRPGCGPAQVIPGPLERVYNKYDDGPCRSNPVYTTDILSSNYPAVIFAGFNIGGCVDATVRDTQALLLDTDRVVAVIGDLCAKSNEDSDSNEGLVQNLCRGGIVRTESHDLINFATVIIEAPATNRKLLKDKAWTCSAEDKELSLDTAMHYAARFRGYADKYAQMQAVHATTALQSDEARAGWGSPARPDPPTLAPHAQPRSGLGSN